MLRELICVVAVFGLLSGSSASAAPEPEEPTPTVQPGTEEPKPVATLVVNTTVLTAQPRSGSDISVQVWVSATGAAADNATLTLDAGAGVTVTPRCTLAATAATTCRLGTVDAQGVTIPLTLETAGSTAARTITLTATADAATAAAPVRSATPIALAAAPTPTAKPTKTIKATPKPTKTTKTPKPTKTTKSPKPVKSQTPAPQTTTTSAAPVVVPPPAPPSTSTAPSASAAPAPSLTASNTPELPQIAPEPVVTTPYGNILLDSPSPLPSSTLLGNRLTPLSAALTTAHGIWLGALLTAVLGTLLLARRRARARKQAARRSARHRYTPRSARHASAQEKGNLTPAVQPVGPIAVLDDAEDTAVATVQAPLDYLNALRAAFGQPAAAERETWQHGTAERVEYIGNADGPRQGAAPSPPVRESRSLSWVWANITRSSPGGPAATMDDSYRRPDAW